MRGKRLFGNGGKMELPERIAQKARELYGCRSICGQEADAIILNSTELIALIAAEIETEKKEI